MAKSAIYLVNNSQATITDGSVIPLGTIIRRYGQHIRQDGNSITACDKPGCPGYYKVDVVASIEPTATAPYKVILEKDGVAVIGGVAEINPAPTTVVLPFPISVIVKNACGGTANLSLRLEGGDATAINITTAVEKL